MPPQTIPSPPDPVQETIRLYREGKFGEVVGLADRLLPGVWPAPAWQSLLTLRGLARLKLGLVLQAAYDFDDVLKVEHDPVPFARANAAYGRGKLKHLKGDVWGAFQDFSLSLQTMLQGAEKPLDRESRASMEKVIRDLKGAAEDDPYYHLQRGNFYRVTGDLERALREFERAAALKPDNPTMQIRLGEAFLACNEPLRARAALERALRADPDRPAALVGLARVAVREGKLGEALALLERAGPCLETLPALLQDPDFVPLHSHPRWKTLFGSLPPPA